MPMIGAVIVPHPPLIISPGSAVSGNMASFDASQTRFGSDL